MTWNKVVDKSLVKYIHTAAAGRIHYFSDEMVSAGTMKFVVLNFVYI